MRWSLEQFQSDMLIYGSAVGPRGWVFLPPPAEGIDREKLRNETGEKHPGFEVTFVDEVSLTAPHAYEPETKKYLEAATATLRAKLVETHVLRVEDLPGPKP